MSDAANRLAALSAEEQRSLLEQILQKQSGAPGAFPLSFAQQRLWFLDQLQPGSAVYNMRAAVRLTGSLKAAALEASLNEIVHRHAILRATFTGKAGQPAQIIAPSRALPLRIVDLQPFPEAEREAESQRQGAEDIERPFDLSQGPLLRPTLFRLNPAEHVLYLAMHHIVSDGWSIRVFIREMAALYEAFAGERPPSLPDLPLQYIDYAQWQRQTLQGETLQTQVDYWKAQLGGRLPALALPTDRPRSAVQTFRGARQTMNLPAALFESLQALGLREGVTPFMVLLAAFKVLLHRYTGQTDIIVGSPVANRPRAELEVLIGLFVNTLVLRTDLSGDPTFRELLGRVRRVTLGAYAHQDLPFEKLVEELQPERDLSRNPLFQVLFTLQNIPLPELSLPGLTIRPLEPPIETAKFDLTFALSPDELSGGLTLVAEYNTDLFESDTIARLMAHFQTILEGAVADPDECLSALPLLTATERRRLLVDWNQTQATDTPAACLHTLIEGQASRTPDATAIVFQDHSLTYGALDRRASQLAHYLKAIGVGPEMRVGIYLERSLDLMIGLLGVLKVGGAYVPVDPAYPKSRLQFIIDDAQLSVFLTEAHLRANLAPQSAPTREQTRIICLDADWSAVPAPLRSGGRALLSPFSILHSPSSPDQLAYIIYTSGSTGMPKGVQVSHRAVVNCLTSMRKRPGLSAQDIVLALTTISFDIAALELFLPLIAGGRAIIASREAALDGERLLALLADSGATMMQATPITWWLLLNAGWSSGRALKVFCGGEALPRALANELLDRGATLWNLCGPTETTIWSLAHPVAARGGPVPIGKPIDNTQVYVLDAKLQPVPIGVPGELYIGGDGLARGYLNRPDLTAERFIPNPFLKDEGGGMKDEENGFTPSFIFHPSSLILYKTGDIARYLPDGTLEFLGRRDHQVKIRGFRIELGEIEATLARHPAIGEAVVMVRESAEDDVHRAPAAKRLVAYLVVKPGQATPTSSELHAFAREKLPDYMVPLAFMILDALPLTPNGKIDRLALPDAAGARPALEPAYIAPGTALEQTLAASWRAVLKIETIGVRDNFFELGGHSLLLVQAHRELRKTFGDRLTLIDMFKYPTISALAKHLKQIDSSEPSASQQSQSIAQARLEAIRQRAQLRPGR